MTGTATVYLLRHPETTWNAEGRCHGHADAPFTATGEEQLRELRNSLRDVAFDAVYASPLGRARRTAESIAEGRGVPIVSVPELVELDYGDLQGVRFADWPAGLHDRWRADPWSVTFAQGESLDGLRARVLPSFHRIISAHHGETVLISSHGHVNRVLLLATDPTTGDFWSLEQANASIVVLRTLVAPA